MSPLVRRIRRGAPSLKNEKKREQEPGMHQTRKGNQWFFGMKMHLGVDRNSDLIHSAATTAVHVSNVVVAAELLHGKERVPGHHG